MMKKNNSLATSGFTLVELVVYIAVASLIMAALTAISVTILKVSSHQTSSSYLLNDLNLIDLKLDRLVTDAKLIQTPSEGSASSYLAFKDSNDEDIVLLVEDEKLLIKINDDPVARTSEQVKVSDLLIEQSHAGFVEINFVARPADDRYQDEVRVFNYQFNKRLSE